MRVGCSLTASSLKTKTSVVCLRHEMFLNRRGKVRKVQGWPVLARQKRRANQKNAALRGCRHEANMPVDRNAASDGLQGARMVAEDGGRGGGHSSWTLSGCRRRWSALSIIRSSSPPFHKLAKTILKSKGFEIRPLTKSDDIFVFFFLLLPLDLPSGPVIDHRRLQQAKFLPNGPKAAPSPESSFVLKGGVPRQHPCRCPLGFYRKSVVISGHQQCNLSASCARASFASRCMHAPTGTPPLAAAWLEKLRQKRRDSSARCSCRSLACRFQISFSCARALANDG